MNPSFLTPVSTFSSDSSRRSSPVQRRARQRQPRGALAVAARACRQARLTRAQRAGGAGCRRSHAAGSCAWGALRLGPAAALCLQAAALGHARELRAPLMGAGAWGRRHALGDGHARVCGARQRAPRGAPAAARA